jgi:histone H3/H4
MWGYKILMSDLGEKFMSEANLEQEVLVVASKLKKFIKDQSGMSTSATVMNTLSEKIREMCQQAINSAQSDGRKTVMDRDFSA